MQFYYFGTGSGDTVTFNLLDNAAATTGDVAPSEWVLTWSDEFDTAAGTTPNTNVWSYEIGDGWLNDITGWGNGESQFYTDDPANAAMDGNGNLVITLDETTDDSMYCWYGTCEHTSARLISRDKLEAEYGRVEARIKVPYGGDGVPANGLWPAFWMLGNDLEEVGWPQSGEIDIMEVVSREPYDVFGTIHGPGYQGGASFGDIYVFPNPVADDFHTFAVEWIGRVRSIGMSMTFCITTLCLKMWLQMNGCLSIPSMSCSTWRLAVTSAAQLAMM